MNRAVNIAMLLMLAGAVCSRSDASDPQARGERVSALSQLRLPSDARVGVAASQVYRALSPVAEIGEQRLRSNAEIARGSTASVYEKVAPATVLIHTGNTYGTGFLISEDGWILTNHHVAVEGPIHAATGVRMVMVYLGRMHGRIMEVDEQGIAAVVYKTSQEQDLALLKLTSLPDGVESLPIVSMAEEQDRLAELALQLQDGVWKAIPAEGQPMFDPTLFDDEDLRPRFDEMLGGSPRSAEKPQQVDEKPQPAEEPQQADEPTSTDKSKRAGKQETAPPLQ